MKTIKDKNLNYRYKISTHLASLQNEKGNCIDYGEDGKISRFNIQGNTIKEILNDQLKNTLLVLARIDEGLDKDPTERFNKYYKKYKLVIK